VDWSKIKTIFIVAFLLLDFYLIYEYTQLKKDNEQFETEEPETPISKTLALDGIKYDEDKFPTNVEKGQYLTAKSMTFSDEDVEGLEKDRLSGQSIRVQDSTMLQSILEKPIKLSDDFKKEELADYIKNNILNGDQYVFWEKKDNTITYYQQYNGKTLYHNLKGELTFLVNEENNIVSYNQTYLQDIKEFVFPMWNSVIIHSKMRHLCNCWRQLGRLL
jgi:regulatory protein YycI of two-component signal transduction system YycFG